MKELKPFQLPYHELETIGKEFEKRLAVARLGDDLHDIASPLVTYVVGVVIDLANKHYASVLAATNNSRATIADEILKEVQSTIGGLRGVRDSVKDGRS